MWSEDLLKKKQSCKLLREKGGEKEKRNADENKAKKDWLAGECLEVWFNTANNLTKHISALLNLKEKKEEERSLCL